MRYLILTLAALLLAGCDTFLPRDKSPHQVCGEWTDFHDATTGVYIGKARLCYTEWRTPGVDTTSAEGDADLERTDSLVQAPR